MSPPLPGSRIYIPLWFYLYDLPGVSGHRWNTFTFHYGSTYTTDCLTSGLVRSWFTFHYGSTYTDPLQFPVGGVTHLHSTMVLLIPSILVTSTPANQFTFHYGSTYTQKAGQQLLNEFDLHSTMVLLILRICTTFVAIRFIYIPLWFYLYRGTTKGKEVIYHIYIPLWFYLYVNHESRLRIKMTHLHSTMVLLIRWIKAENHIAC